MNGSDGLLAASVWMVMAAAIIDALTGEPAGLWRRIPHPVVLMGRGIDALERRLNHGHPDRRLRMGLVCTLLVAGTGTALAWAIEQALVLAGFWPRLVLEPVLASTLLAMRSLDQHLRPIAHALPHDADTARTLIARVVGRDPDSLDQAGMARAAIESGAEGFCDGVIAPMFWYLVLGLPGLVCFKAISTLDSMIGHRTPRFAAFGRIPARMDDLANWLPARLSAVLLAAGGVVAVGRGRSWRGMRTAWHEGKRHRSPNAGWPEAAMAGMLGVALAGPRRYDGVMGEDPWLFAQGRQAPEAGDLRLACRILWLGWGNGLGILALAGAAIQLA